jgi:hypothetical protein
MMEKTKECVNIMKKITESLGLPADSDEVTELRQKMNDYIRCAEGAEGAEAVKGTVDFSRYGRIAEYNFPSVAGKPVEVTLKKIVKSNSRPIDESKNSV